MSLPNGHGSPGGRSHFDRPDWKCTEQPDCGCWARLDKAGVSLPEARESEERGEQKQTDESLVAELARLSPFEYGRKRKDTAKAIGIMVATLYRPQIRPFRMLSTIGQRTIGAPCWPWPIGPAANGRSAHATPHLSCLGIPGMEDQSARNFSRISGFC